MARLTARFWVDAYLARLRVHDIPAFVVAHGDDTGGAVLVTGAQDLGLGGAQAGDHLDLGGQQSALGV